MRTIETNVTNIQRNCYPANTVLGFDRYENNVDFSIAYISLNETRQSVIDELDGYTKLSQNKAVNGLNNAETTTEITGIGAYAFGDAVAGENETFFKKDVTIDSAKVGETDHLSLSEEQTGKCFNKTAGFYDLEIVTEEDGITSLTEEDVVTYIIED